MGIHLARGLKPVRREVADSGEFQFGVGVEIAGQVRAPVAVADQAYVDHSISPFDAFLNGMVECWSIGIMGKALANSSKTFFTTEALSTQRRIFRIA